MYNYFQLSCFLKNYNSCEIETACEAGESKERDITNASPNEKYNIQLNPSTTSINLEIKSHSLPNIKRGLRSGELKVFKHQIGGCINGAPMTDPLHLIKDSDALSD